MTKTVSQLTRRLASTANLSRVTATVCVRNGMRKERIDVDMDSNDVNTNGANGISNINDIDDIDSTGFVSSGAGVSDIDDTRAAQRPDVPELDADGIDGVTRSYQLRDDRRTIIFKGVKLATVSSERDGVQRWTDIDIYRTDAGRYVVNRVGVSVVAHSIDCSQVANKRRYGIDKIMPDECAPRHREPCPICRPDIIGLLETDPAGLTFEQDKHRTSIWDQAPAMIDSLYSQSTANQRALSGLMLWALSEAAKRDPLIMDAYNRVVEID